MAWTTDEIITERLRLRPFREVDKPAIIALRTNEEVARFLGGPAGPAFADELADATVGEQSGVFGIIDSATDAAIGSVHLGSGRRGVLELVYELLPSFWGQGIAAEAVTAVLQWAVAEFDETEVIAVTQTANTRSVTLLGRLGFVLERTFEEFDAELGWFRRPLR